VNSIGGNNAAIGFNCMYNNTTGSPNTGIGNWTMISNITGNYNTALGSYADVSTDGLSNATAVGYDAIVDASNKVRIGNTDVTVIEGQVPFTTPSDGRFKFNVREDVKGLDFILKLRPVTYQFNTKKEDDFIKGVKDRARAVPVVYNEAMMVRRTGFIAQEVEKAARQSGYDFEGLKAPKNEREYYSLSYASFVVPLVKAVQEQEGVIRQQQERIDDLSKEVKELRQLILTATKK
jgi:trimeric autotransporter adhesin